MMAENSADKRTETPAETQSVAWQKTELARHPKRPYPMEFIQSLFTDFSEIHGDRVLWRRSGDVVRHGAFSR